MPAVTQGKTQVPAPALPEAEQVVIEARQPVLSLEAAAALRAYRDAAAEVEYLRTQDWRSPRASTVQYALAIRKLEGFKQRLVELRIITPEHALHLGGG